MNPKPIEEARDPDLRGAHIALQRASVRARQVAARTGTAVVYLRDGKLVNEYPKLDELPRSP